MSSILKINGRVKSALSMRDKLNDSASSFYLAFGRSIPWPNDTLFPDPIDSDDIDRQTRENLIGMKRVNINNCALVIPRIDWTLGTVYNAYSSSNGQIFLDTFKFYVLSGQNVYKCLGNNNGSPSINAPSGTSTGAITTADGYIWKFMYNLNTSLVTQFLTSLWMPVPVLEQKSVQQIAVENSAIDANNTPSGGHGKNAAFELGATRIMFSQIFDKSESGVFPVDVSYRQSALYVDPVLLFNPTQIATGNVYRLNSVGSEINTQSGSILSIENFSPIARSNTQAERIRVVIGF